MITIFPSAQFRPKFPRPECFDNRGAMWADADFHLTRDYILSGWGGEIRSAFLELAQRFHGVPENSPAKLRPVSQSIEDVLEFVLRIDIVPHFVPGTSALPLAHSPDLDEDAELPNVPDKEPDIAKVEGNGGLVSSESKVSGSAAKGTFEDRFGRYCLAVDTFEGERPASLRKAGPQLIVEEDAAGWPLHGHFFSGSNLRKFERRFKDVAGELGWRILESRPIGELRQPADGEDDAAPAPDTKSDQDIKNAVMTYALDEVRRRVREPEVICANPPMDSKEFKVDRTSVLLDLLPRASRVVPVCESAAFAALCARFRIPCLLPFTPTTSPEAEPLRALGELGDWSGFVVKAPPDDFAFYDSCSRTAEWCKSGDRIKVVSPGHAERFKPEVGAFEALIYSKETIWYFLKRIWGIPVPDPPELEPKSDPKSDDPRELLVFVSCIPADFRQALLQVFAPSEKDENFSERANVEGISPAGYAARVWQPIFNDVIAEQKRTHHDDIRMALATVRGKQIDPPAFRKELQHLRAALENFVMVWETCERDPNHPTLERTLLLLNAKKARSLQLLLRYVQAIPHNISSDLNAELNSQKESILQKRNDLSKEPEPLSSAVVSGAIASSPMVPTEPDPWRNPFIEALFEGAKQGLLSLTDDYYVMFLMHRQPGELSALTSVATLSREALSGDPERFYFTDEPIEIALPNPANPTEPKTVRMLSQVVRDSNVYLFPGSKVPITLGSIRSVAADLRVLHNLKMHTRSKLSDADLIALGNVSQFLPPDILAAAGCCVLRDVAIGASLRDKCYDHLWLILRTANRATTPQGRTQLKKDLADRKLSPLADSALSESLGEFLLLDPAARDNPDSHEHTLAPGAFPDALTLLRAIMKQYEDKH